LNDCFLVFSFTTLVFEALELIAMKWLTGKGVVGLALAVLPSCIRCYAPTDSIQDTVRIFNGYEVVF
jgi:hypothetical protein